MKSLFTKRVIIIFSVILFITVGSVILAFSLNNTNIPSVENGDEIVYERLDENGDVIYTITKEELYEEMIRNNGMNQVLSLIDEQLLGDYLDNVTQEEIDDKIEFLKYQTNDQEVIDAYDEETKTTLEENYERLIVLSGYHNDQEERFARLIVARENYAREQILENDDITENEIAEYFLNSYFEDIKALRLRFLSKADAENVLFSYNLAELGDKLVTYKGFTYKDETLKDDNEDIVDAQITVDTFYYDFNDNLLDMTKQIVYDEDNGIYTDRDDNTYTIDESGNLLDDEENIVIENTLIFDSYDDALAYKEANTTFFKIVENNDIIEVYDYSDQLVYKVDGTTIYDPSDVDVTDTVDLRFNKVFEAIEDVDTFTSNNTNELTDEEVLTYYIKMYNFIYSEYRTVLDENASLEDLLALDNEYFDFNYEDVKDQNASLAKYMFSDISQLNDKVYAAEPRVIGDYAYMVYKLEEADKVNLKAIIMETIKETINLPEVTNTDIPLPTEGPYDSTIKWTSSKKEVIANDGTVTIPDEDTLVSLSYTINALGVSETGTIIVRIPTNMTSTTEETSEEPTVEEYPSLKSLIDDETLFEEIKLIILDEKLQTSATIDEYMVKARQAANFKIHDYYVAMNYRFNFDADFDFNKGHDKNLASIDVDGSTYHLTAESFYQSALDRNPTLMIFYASQLKEAIHSEHYQTIFGNETNIEKNETDRMNDLRDNVQNFENLYNFMIQQRDTNPQMFNYYKMIYGVSEANFDSYQLFIYSALNVRTDAEILENFVLDELRLLFIKDVLEDENITNDIYDVAQDNFNNYFSLKAEHILIHFDYDEDGSPDDYNEYYNGLSAAEQSDLDALLSGLETSIREQEASLEDIVKAFEDAKRDDEDWGAYKQAGFLLKYESLNPTENDNTENPITYTYAKNTFVDEFTNALINLYEEYRDPLNSDEETLLASNLVETEFGLHLIEVTKDAEDNLEGISFEINEGDYTNISESLLNDQAAPSLEQIETYYTYKLYESFYNLDNIDVEEIYNIQLPEIPEDVLENLNAVAEETLEPIFGNFMVNYAFMLQIQEGETQSDITQSVFDNNIELLLDIYRSSTIEEVGLEE
jgi:hypothetical protein